MDAKKILVIDNDVACNKLITEELSRIGCELICCYTAQEGLMIACSAEVNLIIVSVELSDENGFVTCAKLKKNPRTVDIPVFILSSAESTTAFEQHRQLPVHADGYFLKPLDIETLIQNMLDIFSEIDAYNASLAEPAADAAASDEMIDVSAPESEAPASDDSGALRAIGIEGDFGEIDVSDEDGLGFDGDEMVSVEMENISSNQDAVELPEEVDVPEPVIESAPAPAPVSAPEPVAAPVQTLSGIRPAPVAPIPKVGKPVAPVAPIPKPGMPTPGAIGHGLPNRAPVPRPGMPTPAPSNIPAAGSVSNAAEISRLNAELASLKSELASKDAEIASIIASKDAELAARDAQINDYAAQANQYADQTNDYFAKANEYAAQANQYADEIDALHAENEALRVENEAFRQQLDEADARIQNMVVEFQNMRAAQNDALREAVEKISALIRE